MQCSRHPFLSPHPSALMMPSSSTSSSSPPKIICLHVLFRFRLYLELAVHTKDSRRPREKKKRKKGCESLKTKKKQSLWASHRIYKEVKKPSTEPEELIVLFPKLLCMCVSIKSVAVTMLVDSATQWPFIHRKGMEKNEETDMQMSKIRKKRKKTPGRERNVRAFQVLLNAHTHNAKHAG